MTFLNLPPDMKVGEIEKLFDISNSSDGSRTGKVVMEKLKRKIIVKVIVSKDQANGILQFDQTVLHKRTIQVYIIEKCNLGSDFGNSL